jgi:hypothetical protein
MATAKTGEARWRRVALLLAGMLAAGALMALPPWAFIRWREGRLRELSQPAVQAEWDRFRDRMRRESGRDGPVQRKVPKSAEPPELVWLRDYWRLAIAAWVVFVGVMLGLTAVLVRGAVASAAENGPGGRRHDQEQDQRDAQDADEGKHPPHPVDDAPGP